MEDPQAGVLIEIVGILEDVLADIFYTRIPVLLDRHRSQRIRMMVTTRIERIREETARNGSLFQPAREGRPSEFTWKARGIFQAVIRQFRLDFLRHLRNDEIRSIVFLSIQLDHVPLSTLPSLNSPDEKQASGESILLAPSAPENPATGLGDSGPPDALAPQPAQPMAQVSEVRQPGLHPEPLIQTQEDEVPLPPRPVPDEARPGTAVHSRNALPGNFYLDYFGFECMPFNNTPDSHFYFPTQKHEEALSRLLYAISERKGFVMISGEIGSGKSTLCRTLLAQLPREVKTALITHTHIDADLLLQAISEDLGLETRDRNRYEILQRLNEYLIEQLAAGCTVCIIIDEAQNLSPAALEEVRMVSNLETEQEKLVQLILLGQPDLRDKIRLPQLRQLRQRISVQYHLEPLDCAEAVGYIRHRLKVANPAQTLNFTRRAMIEAYRYSGGVPRLINSLCDNALLTAFTRQTRTITHGLIREAGQDLDLEPQTTGLAHFFKFW